ncbi:porin [Sphingomonas sanguinis]|uniref:Porin n=1 Tax=Sphingomonas sanguinis TaxID=33051 RepID=A0A147IK87_9SPHN|nr:porin [Sphingomonas sanguinis]KTT93790.1 porin [Sphingomonas sanguinis]
MKARLHRARHGAAVVIALSLLPAPAAAQTVQELQRQIDELKAQIKVLTEAQKTAAGPAVVPPTVPPTPMVAAAPVAPTVKPEPERVASIPKLPSSRTPWYDRLRLRGYTQLRYNAVLDSQDAPGANGSRLRSVHDASVNEDGGFLLRRVRLVLQGDITDRLQLYFQHDFGAAVNNQSSTERRENFGQLRDVYADWFLDPERRLRLRFGQSKVPFGWENLQSSSNRLPLDRSDAINSGVPGERDVGVNLYYTPAPVQAIWDRLAKNKQKLFGNYGAFGLAVYNGQGTNRTERNGTLMKVAMATWPFALDGLGPLFRGQVLELGGSAMFNRFRPELRSGGISPIDYRDDRVAVHAILYPQPFGIQTEWTTGWGPQYDGLLGAVRSQRLGGGYVQLMADIGHTPLGRAIPYARWQRYRGGWKPNVDAPRLETDEWELGTEIQLVEALELTLAYARMERREADARRTGRATGDLIRTQLQFTY